MQPSHHPDRPESTRSKRMFACSTGRASTADVVNLRNGISATESAQRNQRNGISATESAQRNQRNGISATESAQRNQRNGLSATDSAQRTQRNGLSSTTPDNTLPGLKPAEIAVLYTLHRKYNDADWAQTKAQRTAEQALELLKLEVEDTLIPLRRKCQARAELAFPHTDKKNRITRKSLHLPPDKRAID